jgi:molybdenum cofactor cytidylyltransferase
MGNPAPPQPNRLYRNEFMTDIAPEITVILLAAGASSRMKTSDKLLEKVDGVPMLARVAKACLGANATNYIAVTRPDDTARKTLIPALFHVVGNPDWREGMATSLRFGLKNVGASCDAVLVVLADMPDVSTEDMNAVIAAFRPENGHSICRAMTQSGRPGHPVLFGREHFAALEKITGDNGARTVLAANPKAIAYVKTAGNAALTDLDTPADWAAYRGR